MGAVTPYLCCDGAADAIEFYKRAFGAEELYRLDGPGDMVGHAEISIGDSRLMLSDEWPEGGILGPTKRGGATTAFSIEVDDVDALDAAWARAIGAGATEEEPLTDKFYGYRSGTMIDPFGHRWTIATVVEEVSPEEMQRRMEAEFGT